MSCKEFNAYHSNGPVCRILKYSQLLSENVHLILHSLFTDRHTPPSSQLYSACYFSLSFFFWGPAVLKSQAFYSVPENRIHVSLIL